MAYEVLFRLEAREEALDAAAYIADNTNTETALRWYEGLEASLRSLEEMPLRCPLAPEDSFFPNELLRHLLYKRYRIIFTVRGTTVHILHVRHGARRQLTQDELTNSRVD